MTGAPARGSEVQDMQGDDDQAEVADVGQLRASSESTASTLEESASTTTKKRKKRKKKKKKKKKQPSSLRSPPQEEEEEVTTPTLADSGDAFVPSVGRDLDRATRTGPIEEHPTGRERSSVVSSSYWEKRYKKGGNSGGGSYGRRALTKAVVMNAFLHKYKVKTVAEFGCGDGNQLTLMDYVSYTGYDVSATAVANNQKKFSGDSTKQFMVYSAADPPGSLEKVDMSLSLEVIFHLTEGPVFEHYMRHLFATGTKYVFIQASNQDDTLEASHVRHWRILDYIKQWFPEWRHFGTLLHPDPSISFSDFYFFCKGAACPPASEEFSLRVDFTEAQKLPMQ